MNRESPLVLWAWSRGYTVASTREGGTEVVIVEGTAMISVHLLRELHTNKGMTLDEAVDEVYFVMWGTRAPSRTTALEDSLNALVDQLTEAVGIPKLLEMLEKRARRPARRLWGVLLLLAFASPVAAQDAPFSDVVEVCITTTTGELDCKPTDVPMICWVANGTLYCDSDVWGLPVLPWSVEIRGMCIEPWPCTSFRSPRRAVWRDGTLIVS